jgi:hypothetical protein
MIKINKGIEMPKTTQGRKTVYPFAKMEVGDSFEYPDGILKGSLLWAAKSWAKRNKKKWDFSVRTIDGKFRLWRTR